MESGLSFGSFGNDRRISVLFLSPASWLEVHFGFHLLKFREP